MSKINKTFLLVISFTLSLITFVTSSFAWMSMAQINYLDGFQMSVVADGKMQLSLDGINYYDSIPP